MSPGAANLMPELAQFLREYGGWGVAVIEIGMIGILWKELLKSHRREMAMAERILPLVEEMRTMFRMSERGRK